MCNATRRNTWDAAFTKHRTVLIYLLLISQHHLLQYTALQLSWSLIEVQEIHL